MSTASFQQRTGQPRAAAPGEARPAPLPRSRTPHSLDTSRPAGPRSRAGRGPTPRKPPPARPPHAGPRSGTITRLPPVVSPAARRPPRASAARAPGRRCRTGGKRVPARATASTRQPCVFMPTARRTPWRTGSVRTRSPSAMTSSSRTAATRLRQPTANICSPTSSRTSRSRAASRAPCSATWRKSMPVTLGVFDMNMITQAGGGGALPGMSGTIGFNPDPQGPYSAEIGLVQAINITDVAGATNPASGMPVDWRQVTDSQHRRPGNRGGPHGNDDPRRRRAAPRPAGTSTASLGHSARQQHRAELHRTFRQRHAVRLAALTDRRRPGDAVRLPAVQLRRRLRLRDRRQGHGQPDGLRVAVLGLQHPIRRGGGQLGVRDQAVDRASAVFEEALERFRGYYVHEPIVLYFDTGDPIPRLAKKPSSPTFSTT